MKIYAFGDIHGEYDKLEALISKLVINDDDLLIFLGDYIDRGKKSFEVIEYLINLGSKHNCVFLKGNHESMLLDYLAGIYETTYLNNGGNKTLKSYYKHGFNIQRSNPRRKLPDSHLKFFLGLKFYYQTDDYIFVHAGLWPGMDDVSKMPLDVLLWERSHFISSNYDWGKKVIFGHTCFKRPVVMKNKIGIDTGACHKAEDGGGVLTCVMLPDEVFIQQGPVVEEEEKDGDGEAEKDIK